MRAGTRRRCNARAPWYGPPPASGGRPGRTSRERLPRSAITDEYPGEYGQRERSREARQRRAAPRQRVGMEMGDEAGPPIRPDRRQPLIQREADEPRADHSRPNLRNDEDVVAFVVPPREQPVRQEHGEQRHEERAQEVQEVLIVAKVDDQRAGRR